MKNYTSLLSIVLVFLGTAINAQSFEAPKSGATIEMDESSIVIGENGEASFELWINRSKRASKTGFKTPKISGSKEVVFEVSADPENQDHFFVTAKSESEGFDKLSYVVSSSSTGYHQVKGRMFSIKSNNPKQLVSTKDN